MSKRSPELFIQDMLEAIEKIERYTEQVSNNEVQVGNRVQGHAWDLRS